MAITITGYNHTAAKLMTLDLDAEAANFYLMLVDGTTAFDATHTTLDTATDSFDDAISGTTWTATGENLTNVTVSTVNTNSAKFDADDLSVTAGATTISAEAAILYINEGGADTTYTPLWYIDFGETRASTEGNPFAVNWDANGIATIAVI